MYQINILPLSNLVKISIHELYSSVLGDNTIENIDLEIMSWLTDFIYFPDIICVYDTWNIFYTICQPVDNVQLLVQQLFIILFLMLYIVFDSELARVTQKKIG